MTEVAFHNTAGLASDNDEPLRVFFYTESLTSSLSISIPSVRLRKIV